MPSPIDRSPAPAQHIWTEAHKSAVEEYGEGGRAHRVGYAALKHRYKKQGKRWVPKEDERERRGPSYWRAGMLLAGPRRKVVVAGRAHRRRPARATLAAALALALPLLAAGCLLTAEKIPEPEPRSPGETLPLLPLTPAPDVAGDPSLGRRLFLARGCGGCHTLRGLVSATGAFAPALDNVVLRPTLLDTQIAMTPDSLTAFLLEPNAVEPDSEMPDVGLTPEEARHITAFLYSQPYNPSR